VKKNSKIYIAGHRGLVGSAIVKNLEGRGYTNLVYQTHKELDLLDAKAVADFFEKEKPEYVVLAAAKVGGIVANNTYRADFIYENLQVQNNVIHQSYLSGVKKLLFLGSTCIYPKNAPQPMSEESLLTSELEYTNEPYAIAKIAGIKMCESYNIQYGTNFISVMPTNLYGPNDNFDLEKSHVLPALIRKIHCAKLLNEKRYDEVVKDLGLNTINEAKEYLSEVISHIFELFSSGWFPINTEPIAGDEPCRYCDFTAICGQHKNMIADKHWKKASSLNPALQPIVEAFEGFRKENV
jgi:GDP-L-fucose synthase